MALSNAYLPVTDRVMGSVGVPLPDVMVNIVDIDGDSVSGVGGDGDSGSSTTTTTTPTTPMEGELRIKGPAVFSHYYNRPSATAAAFDADGWFCTGDIVRVESGLGSGSGTGTGMGMGMGGRYSILGRNSTDIIKVSACVYMGECMCV